MNSSSNLAKKQIKQSLSQKMLQKLSPQQIQLMKLLQIPTVSLEQRIKEELEANPALEEGNETDEANDLSRETEESFSESEEYNNDEPVREETFELDDYLTEYIEEDPATYKLKADHYSADDEEKTVPVAVESSFHEFLEQQLGLLELEDERTEIIAKQIIGSIEQ